ncbi:probable adenine glycosylase [Prochlorococcus marinus str. MIT 9313]|uniref:Adenine DNA glycosylase n=1 Tax=Prochlorococcus marinus (strain MIT 9313) TaxID=74547 RepID=Q7V929_PROMM|nr:probable adenine glycosylase [Prochlorococcus marinus str. MIT 9313]
MRQQLLAWWEVHGRKDIAIKPWMFTTDGRWPEPNEDLSPYGIWIAEVMLQQTQLRVMRPYWEQWMLVLSTMQHLVAAEERQVLLLWQGLGYYSRARRLHQAARQLAASPLPSSLEAWLAVPGIGRTTAGSILSSALNRPVPILDGNVRRVLARLHGCLEPPQRAQASFWQWSEALLDPLRPRDFNQALMDLGALVCTPRTPSCQLCPWQSSCAAYAAGEPSHFPVQDASKPIPFQVIGVGVVLNEVGEVLIDQRLNEGLLGGLWEFPGGKQEPGEAIEATIARELREELAIEVQVGEQLIALDHAYSHKKLRFVVHLCRWISGEPKPLASQQVCWVKPEDLSGYPFPAANVRMIATLIDHLRADMLSQRS